MARAPFKPTDELRAKVRHLSGVGVPQDDIAKFVGCTAKTLRKHFRHELDQGAAEANAMVAGYLFQAAKEGNVTAMIFWLKTRARWNDRPNAGAADTANEVPAAETPESDLKIFENLKARMLRATTKEQSDG